jgi:hypothetical protein
MSRVTGTGATAESYSFQWMVHKIHTGEELTGDYVLGGTSFKEVLYPGEPEWISEQRLRKEGIFIEDETWARITTLIKEYSLESIIGKP